MLTASWFSYSGPGRIGISRSVPRQAPRGYRRFKPLTPGDWWLTVQDEATYRLHFGEQLAALDPRATWDELHALAAGAKPVLLCWCAHGPKGSHCHRHLVAAWFRSAGFDVAEHDPRARPSQLELL